MARLTHAERLKRERERIDIARRWRRDDARYDDKWRRLIDRYDGKHFDAAPDGEDRIAVNYSFGIINVLGPSIAINAPKISVTARKAEDENRSVIMESVINYWWKHYKIQDALRAATQDFLIFGHGWLKVGWRYRERERPITEEEFNAEFARRAMEVDAYAEQNPEAAGSLPTDEEIAAEIGETWIEKLEDRPFVERVSPFDILVDHCATSLDDAAWIAQRIVRPVEEVRKDRRYEASARNQVKADTYEKSLDPKDDRKKRDTQVEYCTIWEYYNLRAGTVSVFAEDGDGYLVKPKPIPWNFAHPFVMVRNYEVPDRFYPKGDLEEIEPLQDELNKTRSQMMNARKKNQRKYIGRRSAFDDNALAAIKSERDNQVAWVIDDNQPLSEIFQPLPQVQLDPQLYNYSQQIENDINQVSGVSEYQRGTTPEIRRTATEAAILQDAANARAADKLAKIEKAITEVARKLVQLAQTYLTGEHVLPIVGRDGAMQWGTFDRFAIQGEFDFEVEGGSTQPQNDTVKRQNAVGMLQALTPLLGTTIDPLEFTRYILTTGFNIRNPEKFLMDPSMALGMGADPSGGTQNIPVEDLGEIPEEDPTGGADAVPPEIAQQLAGQVGLSTASVGMNRGI